MKEIKNRERVKIIGEKWKMMDNEGKAKYQNLAELDKIRYKNEK
jgi:hypothetical protein